jgi:hypothetical protein
MTVNKIKIFKTAQGLARGNAERKYEFHFLIEPKDSS